jgi:hypothetical protein
MVHSARLERWGGGLTACSGEMTAVHLVKVLVVESYASGSSGTVLGSSFAASGMEDVIHASAGKPYLGF